jgi:D-serine/D-alanine/glycine transporter
VLVVLALAEDTRVALFVTPVWFIMLIAIYKMLLKKADYVNQKNYADQENQQKVAEN